MKIQNPFKLIFQKIRTKITKDIVKKAVYLAFIFLFVNLFILITNNVVFFVEAVQNKKITEISEAIKNIKNRKDVLSITVIDKDGKTISGVDNLENSDNYIFQAIKWKEQILKGQIFSSFDVKGASLIEMVVGQPIVSNEQVIGGLVINKRIDGEYIKYFKNRYLDKNTDIGVFVQNEGIIETSFINKEVEKIFSANIDIDIQRASDIFLSKSNDSLFLNNQEYFIDKLYLEELASEDGAIFLFYKFNYFSKFITPSFIASLFFTVFLLYLLRFRKSRRKIDKKIIFLLFVVLFLTIEV